MQHKMCNITRCTPITPPMGLPFSPHVLLTSGSGTCRTACNSTLTSPRFWRSGQPPSCKLPRPLCHQYLSQASTSQFHTAVFILCIRHASSEMLWASVNIHSWSIELQKKSLRSLNHTKHCHRNEHCIVVAMFLCLARAKISSKILHSHWSTTFSVKLSLICLHSIL